MSTAQMIACTAAVPWMRHDHGVVLALPPPDGEIGDCHDAEIIPDTIIPPWYGERLDLDHAIYVRFANARTEEEKQSHREQASEPKPFRPRLETSEPTEWMGRTPWH